MRIVEIKEHFRSHTAAPPEPGCTVAVLGGYILAYLFLFFNYRPDDSLQIRQLIFAR